MDGLNVLEVRVALVEAHPLFRDALSSLLRSSGLGVLSYADAEVFLSRIVEDRPTVALLDLPLVVSEEDPGADCLSVIREVHRRHPEVALLLLSETGSPETLERCYAEGACGYLERDATTGDSVLEALRAVGRGERVFPVELLSAAFSPAPRRQEPTVLTSVSPREREVLSYVAAGADNLKIATMLRISERTVKAHVTSLYRKLGSENRIQLALEARELGVRPSPFA